MRPLNLRIAVSVFLTIFGITSLGLAQRATVRLGQGIPGPGLTLVREFDATYATDVSDDGAMAILGKDGKSSRVVNLETGKVQDLFDWSEADRLNPRFLPHSHNMLLRHYMSKRTNKFDILIRDATTKQNHSCTINKLELISAGLTPIGPSQIILTTGLKDVESNDRLFLVDAYECGVKEIGKIDLDPQHNDIRSMAVIGILNDRYLAVNIATHKGAAYTGQVFVIWDLKTAKIVKVIDQSSGIWDGGFTRDGKYFYLMGGFKENHIQLYDTLNYDLVIDKILPAPGGGIDFSDDGKYMAFSYYEIGRQFLIGDTSQPTTLIYNIKSWTVAASIVYKKQKRAPLDIAEAPLVRFTPNGKYLITSGPTTAVWRLQLP